MKKIFLFAATAAMLAACSSEELTGVESAQQTAADNAINFSVYTPRTTRAGAAGNNDVAAVATKGFGILAYYTDDEKYDKENSKPTFMYNTKVTSADAGTTWTYNPVMYWPNEFGNTATSDYTDYVSFFAYAPYIDVVNETGIPTVKAIENYDLFAKALSIVYTKTKSPLTAITRTEFETRYNGGAVYGTDADYWAAVKAQTGAATVTTNAEADAALLAAGLVQTETITVDDLAKYQAYIGASDEAAAKAALDNINKEQIQGKNITSISKNNSEGDPIVKYVVDTDPKTSVDLLWGVAADNTTPYYTSIINGYNPIVAGKPFIDLTKPNKPATDKLSWNLRHALSKLNIDIQYIADKATPVPPANTPNASEEINADETRIYVRWIKIGGFVVKGALNLNNNIADKANWLSYDGNTALTSEMVTFFDGRKDGKEGTENGDAANELPQGLNPVITENYSLDPASKTAGVTKEAVNLFGVGANVDAPIFVIPTNDDIDIEICYDVETKDGNLSTFISDGLTHGTSVENKIRKTSKEIFKSATAVKMEDNKAYTIHIILGMTSVKFEASVEPFTVIPEKDVELPYNAVP